jgi:DNA helicase-2/ATP-dependent DNA helicase PcrA
MAGSTSIEDQELELAPFDWGDLRPQQLAPVRHVEGPLLIKAGAGTGKTRTIMYRLAYILEQGQVSPHSLLAITFTRKAAGEMIKRMERLIGENANEMMVVTFHALGLKILQAHGDRIGYNGKKLIIYDEDDAFPLLQEAITRSGLATARWDVREVSQAIKSFKDNLITPQDFQRFQDDVWYVSMRKAFEAYQALLKERNAVDYDDMVYQTCLLLENPEVLSWYQQLYKYITVDEFQDTSMGQYRIVQLLAWGHRNLCCVASVEQSIYAWRGARADQMLAGFREDFPELKGYTLTENFRSQAHIVWAVEGLLKNYDYNEPLTPQRPAGDRIAVVGLDTDWDEANWVSRAIQRLLGEGCRPQDCAVLYRTRAQAHLIEQALMREGIHYTVAGDKSFMARSEVRDLLAYLKLAYDSRDLASIQRIVNRPERGLGSRVLRKIQRGNPGLTYEMLMEAPDREDLDEEIRQSVDRFTDLLVEIEQKQLHGLGVLDLFDYILSATGYQAWVESLPDTQQKTANLELLRSILAGYADRPEPVQAFLEDVLVAGDVEFAVPDEARGVLLSTFHVAKGLEWPVVFIIGLEEDIFPHVRAMKTAAGLDEEIRLAYVAFTRAREKLFLSFARSRQIRAKAVEHAPSRFLGMIAPELRERIDPLQATVAAAAPEEAKQWLGELEAVDG